MYFLGFPYEFALQLIVWAYESTLQGAVHKLCKGGGGSGQVLSYHSSLIKISQHFDRKCYMRGRGVKNGPFWCYMHVIY